MSRLDPVTGRRGAVLAFALALALAVPALGTPAGTLDAQQVNKPVLHGSHWVAITGKPLGATAGARIFHQGGNAVDAAAAMLAATSTMWDVLSWGGETQALIYNPNDDRVYGVNALGAAPTGATAEYFRERDMAYPPSYGPLAAVTPGTPGGLMVMLAEWGTMSLADVLQPAIEMADGYPIEADAVSRLRGSVERMSDWPYTREVFFTHPEDEENPTPRVGEILVQEDLARTLRRLVEAEQEALEQGASREQAIMAAYDRFYRGDIAREFVRGVQEQGGLITMEDLDGWEVKIEEPVMTTYRDLEVYKLTHWVQGPVLLQMLNMLENYDLQAMGYNSARYIHTLYQVMNLAFADRDFYYGDPYFPPEEPIEGLLSKEYARDRIELIDPERNDPDMQPGDPYPYQGGTNPFLHYLREWHTDPAIAEESEGATSGQASRSGGAASRVALGGGSAGRPVPGDSRRSGGMASGFIEDGPDAGFYEDFYQGTTSIQAVDEEGWVVSITPSGGWIPAVIAGNTGVGLSQRMQSWVTDPAENPYNVVEPGKRPRATLTPTLVLKDGRPYVSVAVQGGDSQDQNTLQFLLNMVEWGMNVQEATEAANFNTYQLRGSFGDHESSPGRLMIQEETPSWVVEALERMGYDVFSRTFTSGPLNAVWFDWEHGSFWGGSSDDGDDYGIAW